MIDIKNLIEVAKQARNNAYAPYSNYKVGCALVSKNRKSFFWLQYRKWWYNVNLC